jgi:hypothetical protein
MALISLRLNAWIDPQARATREVGYRRTPAGLCVGKYRSEGNAPLTVQALVEMLRGLTQLSLLYEP